MTCPATCHRRSVPPAPQRRNPAHGDAGRRPAVVLSQNEYNRKVGLLLLCPITSKKLYSHKFILGYAAIFFNVVGVFLLGANEAHYGGFCETAVIVSD